MRRQIGKPRPLDFVKKYLLLIVGWLLVLVGLAVGPLPGPGGIPLILLGATLVLAQSIWARRKFVRLQRRYPRWLDPVRRMLKRKR